MALTTAREKIPNGLIRFFKVLTEKNKFHRMLLIKAEGEFFELRDHYYSIPRATLPLLRTIISRQKKKRKKLHTLILTAQVLE